MEPPKGFWATLWSFLLFLPFFLGLLLLGITKGALHCPVVCLIWTIGNSAIILGLWPVHVFWTYHCIVRTKQLGPALKLVICIGIPVLLIMWPLVGILGSVLLGAGYGFFAPMLATFEAVGEGKTDEFFHCLVDGTWSTIEGSFTVVRDLKDLCFHSYFSIMDDLHLQKLPNGEPYEIRLCWVPCALLVGGIGIIIDIPMITLIALIKSPCMLFKGWRRLFHDLIGREGPFLETACVPFAGLAILLWPAAVAGAVVASFLSSFLLGAYAAVITYQESSIRLGIAYIISSLAIYDEYCNDILDMPEGSCFPRHPYRKKEMSISASFSRPSSFRQEKQDEKNPPTRSLSRSVTLMNGVSDLKPFKLIEQLFEECKRYGETLVAEGVITAKDIKKSKSGKSDSTILSIGLPAYSTLQALLRSVTANSDGLLLSNNVEITSKNRPRDTFFDYFFEPLLIMKQQIRFENFSEEELDYLSKLVLFTGDPEKLKALHAASPIKDERRRAEIDAIARRLQGIMRSISRYPTVRRRFDEMVKSFSQDFEQKNPNTQDSEQANAKLADNASLV